MRFVHGGVSSFRRRGGCAHSHLKYSCGDNKGSGVLINIRAQCHAADTNRLRERARWQSGDA